MYAARVKRRRRSVQNRSDSCLRSHAARSCKSRPGHWASARSVFRRGAALRQPAAPRTQPARVFMVLFGTAPSKDDTDLEPVSNEEIVRRLREACDGVDFVVRDLTKGARLDSVLGEAKDLKGQGYDGVIIYGCPQDYDLLRTGLPTINVAVLNDFMNIPFPLYRQNRVIGAMLDPWRFCADAAVSRADVPRPGRQGEADPHAQADAEGAHPVGHRLAVRQRHLRRPAQEPAANYNETILGAIDATFGTRVTKIGTKEVVEDPYIRELWKNESREANEIAGRWIRARHEDDQYARVGSRALGQGLSGDEAPHAAARRHGHGLPHPHAGPQSAAGGLHHALRGHLRVPAAQRGGQVPVAPERDPLGDAVAVCLRPAQHVGRLLGRHLQQHLRACSTARGPGTPGATSGGCPTSAPITASGRCARARRAA